MRLLVLLLLVAPVAGVADSSHTWFLTAEPADAPEYDVADGLLMSVESTGTPGQARFSSTGLPSNPLAGDEVVDHVDWYYVTPWELDMEILEDVGLVLYVQASAQVSATLEADLVALTTEGRATIAEDTKAISVGSAGTSEVRIDLPARGEILPEGSIVHLRVAITGPSIATIVLYGDDANPSRLEGLRIQPLDSDEDDVPDTLERRIGTDPFDRDDPGDGAFDSDGDGLSDTLEAALGTDPLQADTDTDGWVDGAEHFLGTDPLDAESTPADADGDGLADTFERTHGLDPARRDSDSDGTSDCDEDPDEDGLSNCQEQRYGTDPMSADTDEDGVLDGEEVQRGTDPRVHASPPAPRAPQPIEMILASTFLVGGVLLALIGLLGRHRL